MNLQETAWGRGLDRIDLAENRDRRRALGNIVINLGVPQNPGNLTSSGTASFSRTILFHGVSYLLVITHNQKSASTSRTITNCFKQQ